MSYPSKSFSNPDTSQDSWWPNLPDHNMQPYEGFYATNSCMQSNPRSHFESVVHRHYFVFGEYIATKMCMYSVKTQGSVERLINNILDRADMGCYETCVQQPKSKFCERGTCVNSVRPETSQHDTHQAAGTQHQSKS